MALTRWPVFTRITLRTSKSAKRKSLKPRASSQNRLPKSRVTPPTPPTQTPASNKQVKSRAHSSVGQSRRLIIAWSQVQVLLGPPTFLKLAFRYSFGTVAMHEPCSGVTDGYNYEDPLTHLEGRYPQVWMADHHKNLSHQTRRRRLGTPHRRRNGARRLYPTGKLRTPDRCSSAEALPCGNLTNQASHLCRK